MTVLVTGGAGFIGSRLIERLLHHHPGRRVVCLDNFNDFYDPTLKRANVARFAADDRVTIVERSFGDPACVAALLAEHAVRHIVHLGGYAGVRASNTLPLVYEEANVRGTLAVLEAARAQPVERFVLISSSTVYGPDVPAPFREDGPLGVPLSVYGVTKRAAELAGWHYHVAHGVPVVALRPFSVYGPRTRPDLALHVFASAIVQGKPLTLFGDGTARRDFTHVDDVCAGILAALEAAGVAGQAINLGHHQPVAVGEVVQLLEAALGRKATVVRRPAHQADMPLTCADLAKAERLLGYRPTISFADGVRDFAAWFLSR